MYLEQPEGFHPGRAVICKLPLSSWTSSHFVKGAMVAMAGNTVVGHADSWLVSRGVSRVNALAAWSISIGYHCLFHSP